MPYVNGMTESYPKLCKWNQQELKLQEMRTKVGRGRCHWAILLPDWGDPCKSESMILSSGNVLKAGHKDNSVFSLCSFLSPDTENVTNLTLQHSVRSYDTILSNTTLKEVLYNASGLGSW